MVIINCFLESLKMLPRLQLEAWMPSVLRIGRATADMDLLSTRADVEPAVRSISARSIPRGDDLRREDLP